MTADTIILRTKAEALKYLKKRGYKISVGKFYQDCKSGLVKFEPDNTLVGSEVERYARKRGLQRLGLDAPDGGPLEDLQEQKLKKEIERLTLENQRRTFQIDVEQKKYIPREDFELEMASRAAVLYSGLCTMFKGQARNWIELVGGDNKQAGSLVEDMIIHLDKKFNEYARMDRFEVIFSEDGLSVNTE